MSVVPPEAPIGRPKPAQALVEEMLKTVRRMREEVEGVARESRWEDLNFLIPFEAPIARPLEARLKPVLTVISAMTGMGVPPDQLAPLVRSLAEEMFKARTTAQAGIVKPITPVSREFIDGLMGLARWSNALAMIPVFRGYMRRIQYDLVMLMSLTTYRSGKPVITMPPSEVYSKLVGIEGILQFMYPMTVGR